MKLFRTPIATSFCYAALALMALLIAWPFANLPFNDDWTWAQTVKQLSLTGHLAYNGWSSPSVIAQAYWGLLWVKVFGFSFNILRISTLPMTFGAVATCYLLGRRAGLRGSVAGFVSLLLGTSPIFMPLGATFMTDVPGLFFMLLSLLALCHGLAIAEQNWVGRGVLDSQERKPRTAPFSGPKPGLPPPAIKEKCDDSIPFKNRWAMVGWIVLGSIVALIGGSSRQVVWIVPLVVLPYFGWLRRTNILFLAVSIVCWLIVLGGAIAMQHRFALQPFSLPDPPMLSYLQAARRYPRQTLINSLCAMMTTALMLLPAMLAIYRKKLGARELIGLCLALALGLMLHLLHKPVVPWMGNIFTASGVLGSIEIAGGRAEVLGYDTRFLISILVIVTLSIVVAATLQWLVQQWNRLPRLTINFVFAGQQDQPVLTAMVLLCLALSALEITRAISGVAYDRHLLPFIPLVGIPFLIALKVQKVPAACWAALGLYAMFAIATTQEVNSLARARVTAIQMLENRGVLDTQIEAGFEHGYSTQVQLTGHINDPRLKNPPGAYDASKGPTPDMKVLYRLESEPTAVTEQTPFGQVHYFTFLPPFHRRLFIDRYTDPWWLDAKKAATRPVQNSLLPKVLMQQYGP